jgi:trigger factor
MDSSRPEAEERLRRSLALTALAESEKLTVEDSDIDAKLDEVKQQLAGERDIDPERLRQAVLDDLLQEKLLGWLEENSTITDKAPEDSAKAEKGKAKKAASKSAKPAEKKKTTKAKTAKKDSDGAEA